MRKFTIILKDFTGNTSGITEANIHIAVPLPSEGGGAVDSVNGQTGVVVLDTSDIEPSEDRNYITDAQQTVIENTSGTNTGDNAQNTTSEAYTNAAIATKQDYPIQTTYGTGGGGVIFDRPRVYGYPDAPLTAGIAFALSPSTDKMVVQKIFHQAASAPFTPDSQQRLVAGEYVPNVLNIIYVERGFYSGGAYYLTYWIVQP